MTQRNIGAVGRAIGRPGTEEFSAANVSSASVGRDIDPVIGIDHFTMRAAVFAPHPHAGFSAVTYLFEDGEGEFIDADSLGNRVVAKPGAILWTVAGSGVVHNEHPAVLGERSHGLQIFVNLPSAEKMQRPHLLFADGPDVPVRELPGVRIRVATGRSGDVEGALRAPHDVTLLDVQLEPGATFEESVPPEQSVLIYMIRGSADIGPERRTLKARDVASFPEGDGSIRCQAGGDGAQLVLLAGRPLREPMVAHGPFVMTTEQQIADAIQRYRTGAMGFLP